MVAPKDPLPEKLYDLFVKETFSHLSEAFEIEGSNKRQKVKTSLDTVLDDKSSSAAHRVVDGRFALGEDDSCYLQSGLSLLWTTATTTGRAKLTGSDESSDKYEALAPPGLYQTDAIDGIRTGLIRAMKDKSRQMLEDAPNRLKTAAAVLETLMTVDTLKAKMIEEYSGDADPAAGVGGGAPADEDDLGKFLEEVRKRDYSGTSQAPEDAKKLIPVIGALLEALRPEEDGDKSLFEMIQDSITQQANTLKEVERDRDGAEAELDDLEKSSRALSTAQEDRIRQLQEQLREQNEQKEKSEAEKADDELRAQSAVNMALSTLSARTADLDKREAELKKREEAAASKTLLERIKSVAGVSGSSSSLDLGHMPAYALRRGLYGQRAPLERSAGTTTDDALSYQLPCPKKLSKLVPQMRRLAAMPLTDEERRSVSMLIDRRTAHTAEDALARLAGNFAIVPSAATEAGDIEPSHALRWAPVHGRTGVDMATVAALEHAAARCTALASDPETPRDEATVLRSTAASLKFSQMESLYRLFEETTYAESDDSTPLALAQRGAKGLVTRPCAVVRDVLCFPTDAGVVPEPMDVAQGAHDASVRLTNAMKRTEPLTRKLRNRIRATTGAIPDVYVAPDPAELGFVAAPTGVAAGRDDCQAYEALTSGDYTVQAWRRILQRGLISARSLADDTAKRHIDNVLDEMLESGGGGLGSSAYERRDGLWTEFRRNVAISHDRLWVFVRLMSGCIGGDVNEIVTMADDATMKATKAIQEQRVTISKRVSDMQAKIVETVVGSMVRESKLTMDKRPIGDGPAEELVVIDGGAKQQLNELASGESGRPFFEANVALRNLQDGKAMSKTRLSDLLRSLASVGTQLQESLETTLTQPVGSGATLVELSHPANCYFVSLRSDATAAIRVAHERLNTELGMRHAPRRVSLWELVEGGCTVLVTRFAEFCGYVLVQARSSTGTSAMYVSQAMMMTNSLQARVALERLVSAAMVYCARCSLPSFEVPDAAVRAALTENRQRAMSAGEEVTDRMIGAYVASSHAGGVPELRTSIPENPWSIPYGAGSVRTR